MKGLCLPLSKIDLLLFPKLVPGSFETLLGSRYADIITAEIVNTGQARTRVLTSYYLRVHR